MTNTSAYNKYEDLPHYAYFFIQYLMNNNELIWKLLKYNTPDAWEDDKANLTPEEKGAMIWNGVGDSSDFRVFMDDGQPDVETKETSMLRIYPYAISPEKRTIGTVTFIMEAYSHYKINTLTNYTTRVDNIISQLLSTFNGIVVPRVGAIGQLNFDKLGTSGSRMEIGGQLPFKGKWILMGNKSA